MSRSEECKTNLLLKAKARPEGLTTVVKRGEMGLQFLEFGLLRLSDGEWSGRTGDCEYALDILSGVVSLEVTSPGGESYERLGGREDVFDGPATTVYLPPGTDYRVETVEGLVEVAVFSATAPAFRGSPAVIGPDDVDTESRGRNNWRWEESVSIGQECPAAKLFTGESLIPSGNWADVPPYKHDAFSPPREVPLEEICYFQVSPEQGFGLVRIYTPPNDPGPLNEVYVVENGDTVVIPRGYHPMAAAPGYSLHRTWAMAGEVRQYGVCTCDPRHDWLTGE